MPTINALPGVIQDVSASDLVPLSQTETGGQNPGSVSVVKAPISAILALVPNQGAPVTVPSLPAGASPTTGDSVVMVQDDAASLVPYSQVIDGETIDALAAASAASDTDTFAVGQGTNVLTRQTMGAVSVYVQGKLKTYKPPVSEVQVNSVTIDGATYNGTVIVISTAGTTVNLGIGLSSSGVAFECDIITAGAGTVIWGNGITPSNSLTTMPANSYAKLIGVSYSGGSFVLASVGAAGGSAPAAPGSISGLTLASETSGSLSFTWTAPSTGGTATYYQVQYRVFGSGSGYTTFGTNPTSATVTITGLAPSTQYDVQVAANNSGGVASAFVSYGQVPSATTAAAGSAPGVPSGLTTGAVTGSTVALTWTGPTTGGAPSGYNIEYSSDSGSTWSAPVSFGNTTSGSITSLASSTAYVFRISATNSNGASAYVPSSSYPNATTAASYSLTLTFNGNLPPTSPVDHAGNWPGGGLNFSATTAPPAGATAWLGYSMSNVTPPTSGLTSCASDGQTNGYGQYVQPPASAGTWYVWAIIKDNSGSIIGALASIPITVT